MKPSQHVARSAGMASRPQTPPPMGPPPPSRSRRLQSRVTSFKTSLFHRPSSRNLRRGKADQTTTAATPSHGSGNPQDVNNTTTEAANSPASELAPDDFSYATYVARGGYLPDGSGGKISEPRFAQMKTEIMPFNADRFVALVNSSEKLRQGFDSVYGDMPPDRPTDSELLRFVMEGNQEWKDEVLQRLTGQLRSHWEISGARIAALGLEIDALTERVAVLEGVREGSTGEADEDSVEAEDIKQEEVEEETGEAV
ncbi:hypothetical protein BU16DRAFT_541013 [Lophium mytilinum]|uniref:Uncharacterized protein n=1 Tax=Lophium mytilinum TaxID=390894 RepID=A0A6A6QMG2_9PEZI|nr:hypothetical protein BU16DRAFT_541013 [Lophium mytilinum]